MPSGNTLTRPAPQARLRGAAAAREAILAVGQDRRPYMRAAYDLFRGTGSLNALREAGAAGPGPLFYSLLYEGLFAEANGDAAAAREAISAAARTPYGRDSGDYMARLAAVHCLRRGWDL